MSTIEATRDAAVGVGAGLLAARVMNAATSKLYEWQSEESKEREHEVSPEIAGAVGAKKAAGAIGVELDDQEAKTAATALHYGLGASWAPVYMWLRRRLGWKPWAAGLGTGTAMYVLVDEVANPVLQFTPPPQAFPLATHVRGFLGHAAFGLTLALGVEAGWRLLGGRPR